MKKRDDRGVYRAIYRALWEDPDFQKLPPDAKLVFFNLRTGSLSNIPCLYRLYFEAIEEQTGLPRNRIQKALDTLCDTLWISIQDRIVWVKNALKYDPQFYLNNPKHIKAIQNILAGLPKSKIVIDFCTYYKLEIPYQIPNGIGYPVGNGIHQEQEQEQEQDSGKIPYPDLFESFWNIYPSRDGTKATKKESLDFFKDHFKDDEQFNLLLRATINYANSKQVKDGYAKDPIRFLKKDFWKDWIEKSEDDHDPYKDLEYVKSPKSPKV